MRGCGWSAGRWKAWFVRPIPRNSWGGASQALTALRAPRWMEEYGKGIAMGQMMEAWCKALIADGTFRQQLDPETGVFTEGGSRGYSPAALVLVDYTWRLAGITERTGLVDYNVKPGCAAAEGARFSLRTGDGKVAEMKYLKNGAELWLDGKKIVTVEGTARFSLGYYAPRSFDYPRFRTGIWLKPGQRIGYLRGLVEGDHEVKLTWPDGKHKTFQVSPSVQTLLLKG
jgi:hypothetical protein